MAAKLKKGGNARAVIPVPVVSLFRFDPGVVAFLRIEGEDDALPGAVIIQPPRLAQIACRFVVTSTRGRVITGLRPVKGGAYRGDLLRADGTAALLLAQIWTADDGHRRAEFFHFPTVSPTATPREVGRLAAKLE